MRFHVKFSLCVCLCARAINPSILRIMCHRARADMGGSWKYRGKECTLSRIDCWLVLNLALATSIECSLFLTALIASISRAGARICMCFWVCWAGAARNGET